MKQAQGFVAGTLVHTNTGLVPIEQIKVGDMVLSKPEIGEGELAYKPVVNTFVHEDKEIWFVEISTVFSQSREDMKSGKVKFSHDILVATPNHPFWVVGKFNSSQRLLVESPKILFYPKPYWSTLDQLEIGTVIIRHDGVLVSVDSIQPVFIMKDPELGFIQGHTLDRWWEEDCGSYIDFNHNPPKLYQKDYSTLFNEEVRFYANDGEWDFPTKKRKVYNFEVADYHTYFVGEGGIWVHNNSLI